MHLRIFFFVTFCLLNTAANAVDRINLVAGSITGKDWKLEGVKFEADGVNRSQKSIGMSAKRLILPKPLNQLTLLNLKCEQFIWKEGELSCNKGRASVNSPHWQSLATNFSFKLNPNKGTFKLDEIRWAGSSLSFTGEYVGQHWQGKIKTQHVSHALIDRLLQLNIPKTKSSAKPRQGFLDLEGSFSGHQKSPLTLDIIARANGLTGQTQDGKIATEKLSVLSHFSANKSNQGAEVWHWRNETQLLGGALYVDPVYLEIVNQPVTLSANGSWYEKNQQIKVNHFDYQHPEIGRLTGNANALYRDKLVLNQLDVALHSRSLQALLTTYANPFFTESPFEGMTASGDLDAKMSFAGKVLTAANISFAALNVNHDSKKLAVNHASGLINWSANQAKTEHSEVDWDQLTVKGIPFSTAKLSIISQGNYFELANKVMLPVLDGALDIRQFSWWAKANDEPEVSFAGAIKNISLEKLSNTLGWTPLSGNISGNIPGVNYHNKTLSLGGELEIHVFDGLVKINKLSSSALFSAFPKVTSDISIENMDLEKLTRKFEFGSITGKLTGFVNKLVLENWHPVSFYAWFGTPEDDDSSHSISQKAVNNIASIGGGGATDLISRSFLGFFETFRYDKIGVGCYLHSGVCQMSGVEAAEQGYYLIKGGCLPRIDVMGYNTQVNWDVLVERLARVASPDKAIIQ